MQRRSALIHWLGLVSIVLSLFTPLITAEAFAEPIAPEPELVVAQDAATPDAPVLEPPQAPTVEPTTDPDPSIAPTVEPTVTEELPVDPTVEPTTEVISRSGSSETLAPMAEPNPNSGLTITFTPDSPEVVAGMPIAITITVTTDSVNVFGLQLALPDLAGGNWSAAPVNGECDTDFYCFPFGMGGAPGFELHLTSPTTEASCGTHTISAEAFGTQGSAINSGSFTVTCPSFSPDDLTIAADASLIDGPAFAMEVTIANTGSQSISGIGFTYSYATYSSWNLTADDASKCALAGPTTVSCWNITLGAGETFTSRVTTTAAPYCSLNYSVTAEFTAVGVGRTGDTVGVPCEYEDLELSIASGQSVVSVGGFISYTITLRNHSEFSVREMGMDPDSYNHLDDYHWSPVAACSSADGLQCIMPPLGPGDSTSVTLRGTVTERSCGIEALAANIGWPAYLSASSPITVNCSEANVTVEKTAASATVDEGDIASFTITVSNEGDATSLVYGLQDRLPDMGEETDWTISASDFGALCAITTETDGQYLDCFVDPIAPEESRSITVEHLVTSDVCGSITNTVELYDAEQTIHDSATATITVNCLPVVEVDIDGPATAAPGDEVTYTLTLTNAGNVPVGSFGFDLLVPDIGADYDFEAIENSGAGFHCSYPNGNGNDRSCETLGTFEPGDSFVITLTGTISDAVACDSALTASGTLTYGVEGSDSVTTTVACPAPDPTISINGPASASPGDILIYTITLTNNGDAPLTNGSFNTLMPSPINGTWDLTADGNGECAPLGNGINRCSSITLAPGASATFTFSVQTTATLACGEFTASVDLISPSTGIGGRFTTTITCEPNLSIALSGPESLEPGDPVGYTVTVTNTGTLPVDDASFTLELPPTGETWTLSDSERCTISDDLLTCSGLSVAKNDGIATISVTGNAGYLEICDGFTTRAVLTGAYEGSSDAVTTQVTCIVDISHRWTLITIDGVPGEDFDGDIVLGTEFVYELAILNEGNIPLMDIDVQSFGENDFSEHCGATTLDPGEELVCEATYSITQPDVDRGQFMHGVLVESTAPNGQGASTSGVMGFQVSQSPALELEAEGTYVAPSDGAPHGSIAYTFTATNTGTITLNDVSIYESTGGIPLGLVLACTIDDESVQQPVSLPVGGSITCTSSYVLAQQHVDDGSIRVLPEADSSRTSPSRVYLTTDIPRNPAITIEAVPVGVPVDGFNAGDLATFTITVTNSGDVTLRNGEVSVSAGAMQFDCAHLADPLGHRLPQLAPGASATCTGTLAITQADVEAGERTITLETFAYAPPGADPAQPSDSVDVTVPTNNTPGIGLWMSASPMPDALESDQEITYTLRAENTGTVTLSGVEIVNDDLEGLSALACEVSGSDATQPVTLGPGQVILCTATYSVTHADVDRGSIANSGSVTGQYQDETVADSASLTIGDPSMREASVEITTTASPQNGVTAGTDVTYTYTIRNTGNVTLTDLTVTDDAVTGIDCGDGTNVIGSLTATGEPVECSATFTVSQDIIDAFEPGDDATWSLTSTATVIATTPSGMTPEQVSETAGTTISGPRTIAIRLDKVVTRIDDAEVEPGEAVTGLTAGQVITYMLTATNTGQVTLDDVTITDTLLADLSCDEATRLAPGESITCTGTLTISQDAFDTNADRTIENRGEVTSIDPQGNPVEAVSEVTISLAAAAPAIGITKAVIGETENLAAGDVVEYTIVVSNDGNVTLSDIRVSDDIATSLECADAAPLPVGGTIECTALYTITEADMVAGEVVNIAGVVAAAPDGTEVSAEAAARVTTVATAPSLELVTDVTTPEDGAREGSELGIVFTATNSGNVTLRDVELTTDLDGIEWAGDNAELASLVFMAQANTGGAIGDLAPGESVTVHATYIVTATDAEAGSLRFTSLVLGVGPDGDVVQSDASEVVIEIAQPTPVPTAPPVESRPEATPDVSAEPRAQTVTKLPSTGGGSGAGSALGYGAMLAAATVAALLAVRLRTLRGGRTR